MYLVKPSDNSQSEPVDFYFYPNSEEKMLSLPLLDHETVEEKSNGHRNIIQYSQIPSENMDIDFIDFA